MVAAVKPDLSAQQATEAKIAETIKSNPAKAVELTLLLLGSSSAPHLMRVQDDNMIKVVASLAALKLRDLLGK